MCVKYAICWTICDHIEYLLHFSAITFKYVNNFCVELSFWNKLNKIHDNFQLNGIDYELMEMHNIPFRMRRNSFVEYRSVYRHYANQLERALNRPHLMYGIYKSINCHRCQYLLFTSVLCFVYTQLHVSVKRVQHTNLHQLNHKFEKEKNILRTKRAGI